MTWDEITNLVNRAQAGERSAYGELVQRFQPTVYAVALARLRNPAEAQELAQEVFVHVMTKLDQLRDAHDRDYRLIVLADLCADRDLEVHEVLVGKVFPRQADVISAAELAGLLQ